MSHRIIERLSAAKNFNDRKGGVTSPSMLVLHYTGTDNWERADQYFLGQRLHGDREVTPENVDKYGVSVHYMVLEDGTIYWYVAEDKRAWHCSTALSLWQGLHDINSRSIGIELDNRGHMKGYPDFAEPQIEATLWLCKNIVNAYTMGPHMIVGHSDVQITNKDDPGEKFPWQRFAENGIGLWPDITDADRDAAARIISDESSLRQALGAYGYNVDPKVTLEKLVLAFKRHFQPAAFQNPETVAIADIEMGRRLSALLRMRSDMNTAPGP